MTLLERNQDDPSPIRSDEAGADDGLDGVISALDEAVGPQQLDQPERRILVKKHHKIDAVDRRHDDRAGALIL